MLPSKVMKEVLPLPGLSASEKLVLCFYAYRRDETPGKTHGLSWMRSQHIVDGTGLKLRTVERARAKLVRAGYLELAWRAPQRVYYRVKIPTLLDAWRDEAETGTTANVAEVPPLKLAVGVRQQGGPPLPDMAVGDRHIGGRRVEVRTKLLNDLCNGASERTPLPPQAGGPSLRSQVLHGAAPRRRELRRERQAREGLEADELRQATGAELQARMTMRKRTDAETDNGLLAIRSLLGPRGDGVLEGDFERALEALGVPPADVRTSVE